MIFGLFSNPQREARRLAKDARAVADIARQTYRASVQADIARLTREGLGQLAERCGDDGDCVAREADRYRALHREARRHFNQVGLTAYTFVIIHAQSLHLGAAGEAARQAIRDYLAEWPEDRAPEATLPG
jgi:hypothetical protein